MSTPEPLAAAVAPTLKAWTIANLDYGHPVRTEFVRLALSASLRRLICFGIEDGLAHYSCRELLQCQAMCDGAFAEQLGRIAFARAVLENDREIIDVCRRYGEQPAFSAWLGALEAATPEQARALLGAVADHLEELHIARLVVARRHPALLEAAWIMAAPAGLPQVVAELCRAALPARPELAATVHARLLAQPTIALAIEPDALFAPLVLVSAEHPQVLLEPFAGYYGEGTLLAAAAWHLEHAEPQHALEMCERIRPLSVHADRALLIAGLACLALGHVDEVPALLARIDDADHGGELALRLAQHAPARVDDQRILAIAEGCRPDQPERFVACLKLLLTRRDLAGARRLAAARQGDFAAAPAAEQIIAAVLGRT